HRLEELELALPAAEPRDLADAGRVVAAEAAVRRDLDAVVDDLDPAARVTLPFVRAPCVLRDGDEARSKPRGRVVEAREEAARRGPEVVLDVQVRDDRHAGGTGREPREDVRRRERVRVQDVRPTPPQEAREP